MLEEIVYKSLIFKMLLGAPGDAYDWIFIGDAKKNYSLCEKKRKKNKKNK